jgi:hypothetical protein
LRNERRENVDRSSVDCLIYLKRGPFFGRAWVMMLPGDLARRLARITAIAPLKAMTKRPPIRAGHGKWLEGVTVAVCIGVEGGAVLVATGGLDWDFFSAGAGGVAIAIFFGSGAALLDSVTMGFVSAITGFGFVTVGFVSATAVFGSVTGFGGVAKGFGTSTTVGLGVSVRGVMIGSGSGGFSSGFGWGATSVGFVARLFSSGAIFV